MRGTVAKRLRKKARLYFDGMKNLNITFKQFMKKLKSDYGEKP